MGDFSNQVLLVGDVQLAAIFNHQAATQPIENRIEFSQVTTYQTAIQFIQYGQWDAVLVSQDFDAHPGLEFIQHARMIDGHTPIVLVTREWDDDLDFKARRIGATDAMREDWIDFAYLVELFAKKERAKRVKRNPGRPLFERVVEIFIG